MSGPLKEDRQVAAAPALRILVAGHEPERIEKLLGQAKQALSIVTADRVREALDLARAERFDCIIVDQRSGGNELALLTASLAEIGAGRRLVVLASSTNARLCETLVGVSEVLVAPVAAERLIAAVTDIEPVVRPAAAEAADPVAWTRTSTAPRPPRALTWLARLPLGASLTPLVSAAYKNSALALLAVLFFLFISYGAMIGFFLLSSGWAMPFTLSRGNELVIKTEQELGQLYVRRNQLDEQRDEAVREAAEATRVLASAKAVTAITRGTIEREIATREALSAQIAAHVTQLEEVARLYARITGEARPEANLKAAYAQRLIDRAAFDSRTLGVLEASQRIASLRNEVALQRLEMRRLAESVTYLASLTTYVDTGNADAIVAGGADLMVLATQAVANRTAMAEATARLEVAETRKALLDSSFAIVERSVAALEATPLARALAAPVVVMFVPYENAGEVEPGKSLYGCALAIVLCTRVGEVAATVPGETTAVHPFFGKPLRGFFVEARLDDPDAARQEVLHVSRPLLF